MGLEGRTQISEIAWVRQAMRYVCERQPRYYANNRTALRALFAERYAEANPTTRLDDEWVFQQPLGWQPCMFQALGL